MNGPVLIYGATGFSGRSIVHSLRGGGRDVILAGRNAEKVKALAEPLGAPWRCFSVADPAGIDRALEGVRVVLNAAGPFVTTAPAMIEACLRHGAHYLDIAGEWPVFAEAQKRGPEAAASGVMLMPGAAFSIVATDCLLAMAAKATPNTVLLRLGASLPSESSRGSLLSAFGLTAPKINVRRNGAIAEIATGTLMHDFNFGDGARTAVAVSGPDVITGEQTTGVPSIETYLEAPLPSRFAMRAGALAATAYGTEAVRRGLRAWVENWPPYRAPSGTGEIHIVVEAVDAWRRIRRFGLRTPNGYSVTTLVAVAILDRVLAGDVSPGFQTPAGMFGADFIAGLGCARPFDANLPAVNRSRFAEGRYRL